MDLTAQVLHDAEFREAKRGGYNTQDVDEFLERLAVAVERQEALVRDARQRIAAAEGRAAEAERRAAEAEEHGGGGASDADETLKRTLVLAQRTADAAIREAEERAARMVATAEDEAARLLAEAHDSTAQAYADAEDEARRAQHEARARVVAEMQELEAARDQMRTDVELLERHIDEQRDRLRLAVREMQGLIDDPAALRETAVPAVSDIMIPVPDPAPARQLVAQPAEDLDGWTEAEPGLDWSDEDGDFGPPRALPTAPDGRPAPGPRRPLLANAGPEHDEDDDAYLTELRKAMDDSEPLGPRDEQEPANHDQEPETGRGRFGRRR